jgi:hypothetical protein
MHKRKNNGSGQLDGSIGAGAKAPQTAPSTAREAPTATGQRPNLFNSPGSAYDIAQSSSTEPEKLREMAYNNPGLLASTALIANPNTPEDAVQHILSDNTYGDNGSRSSILKRVYSVRKNRGKKLVALKPRDRGESYDLPAGGLYMDVEMGRCVRCDSRYCTKGCYAGEPGYVYVSGKGYVTVREAITQIHEWEEAGILWGPHSISARVETVCEKPDCAECSAL